MQRVTLNSKKIGSHQKLCLSLIGEKPMLLAVLVQEMRKRLGNVNTFRILRAISGLVVRGMIRRHNSGDICESYSKTEWGSKHA